WPYPVSNAHFRTRQAVIDKLEHHGWSAEEYAALSIIGREDGLRIPEIVARSEKLRGQAISAAIVQKLIAHRLLREVDSTDGHARVRLTPEGRLSVLEVIAIREASEADVRSGMSTR